MYLFVKNPRTNSFGYGHLFKMKILKWLFLVEIKKENTDSSFSITPLSAKGDVSDLKLMARRFINRKTHDHSTSGVDFKEWNNEDCQMRNKKITIQVNDKAVYQGWKTHRPNWIST